MIDLGKKDNLSTPVATESKKEKNKLHYPYLHIDDRDIGIRDEDVGKVIEARIKLKINSVSKNINKEKKTFGQTFDVLGIELDRKSVKGETPDENWDVQEIISYREKNQDKD